MNKLLALTLLIAVSMPFSACTDEPMRRNTVFHNAEDNPRLGSGRPDRSPRYGAGGTHSPSERDGMRDRRRARREINPDPDGIVKPRDLDDERVGIDGSVDDPTIVTDTTPGTSLDPKPESNDPAPSPVAGGGGSEPPYAEAVPGEHGIVYSPFTTEKKKVNVKDENDVPYPPGTEVTDPHTGKVFRVP